MKKVLIAVSDKKESDFFLSLLRKLGFDLETLENVRLLSNTMIEFFPAIVITEYSDTSPIGLELVTALTKNNGWPKVILFSNSQALSELEKVDVWLNKPLQVTEFLNQLSIVSGINLNIILNKYKKVEDSIEEEAKYLSEPIFLFQNKVADVEVIRSDDSEYNKDFRKIVYQQKEKREKRFLQAINDIEGRFDNNIYNNENVRNYKRIHRSENREINEDLEKQRQEFVQNMFKKVKNNS